MPSAGSISTRRAGVDGEIRRTGAEDEPRRVNPDGTATGAAPGAGGALADGSFP